MVEIIWSRRALRDIRDIQNYIGKFDPVASAKYTRMLRDAANSLGDFPNRGRRAGGRHRELATVPPYVIRYRVTGDTVYITHIKHGRQLR